jgi:phosphate transport system protein
MTIRFQRELDKIKKSILSLGTLVEDRVRVAVKAIENRDLETAKKLIISDHEVDEMEVEIEEECLKIMALHQPVAIDLRFLVAVIKINNELESIGDQVVNIAERVEIIAENKEYDIFFDYSKMADKAQAMLKKSLDALVNMDVDLAFKVILLDDEVDELKNVAYDKIKIAMSENPDIPGFLINLLLISRHLERLGDHATNIAEEVIYMVEGEIVRHGNY